GGGGGGERGGRGRGGQAGGGGAPLVLEPPPLAQRQDEPLLLRQPGHRGPEPGAQTGRHEALLWTGGRVDGVRGRIDRHHHAEARMARPVVAQAPRDDQDPAPQARRPARVEIGYRLENTQESLLSQILGVAGGERDAEREDRLLVELDQAAECRLLAPPATGDQRLLDLVRHLPTNTIARAESSARAHRV